MFRLICLCIGYCIGCIETAYVVGRIWQVDLRQHGSGNLGTTNALRVLGKKAGALVFIGDIMKSVIAFVICRLRAVIRMKIWACFWECTEPWV